MTTNEGEHSQVVRQQFGLQAPGFERHVRAFENDRILTWILGHLELQPHLVVLDVAAGTGLLGRALASYVQRVVALDVTPEMLAHGRQQAEAEGINNISFEEGDATRLPYPDNSFDLVACRIGMHHFLQPQVQAQEMVRVCRAGGQVAIVDIVSSPDAEVAASHNRLERLRDPSHTRALSATELRRITEECGLKIVRAGETEAQQNLQGWMDLTHTRPDVRRSVIQAMEEELGGGRPTGMRPFRKDGQLMFHHSWVILVGLKAPSIRCE